MKQKVIFHIDELSKWELLLGNVENLLNAAKAEGIMVEVVANSEAVLGYASSKSPGGYIEAMTALHRRGVLFAACKNAMKGTHITEEDMEPFVVTVPAGIMELVQRQAQGYGYVKP